MQIPWFRILNLLLDVLGELLTGHTGDEVAKRADRERSATKTKIKGGGK